MSPGGGERRPPVSCLLVTGGRNAFAARAVAFFERQDYPEREACGLRRLHFYEPASGRLWLYGPPARFDRWVAGGTLAYTREAWRRHPFPAIQVGEDNEFVRAIPPGRLAGLSDPGLYVALIHSANTSPKRPAPPLWQPQAAGRAAELLGEDLGAYPGFSRGLAG